jgi:hypothetical protein
MAQDLGTKCISFKNLLHFKEQYDVYLNTTFIENIIDIVEKNCSVSGSGEISIGSYLLWSANGAIPEGFFECNGQELSRIKYAKLFKLIGTTYGEGDGETTFNLPKISKGTFIECDEVAGEEKEAGLPNIEGTVGDTGRWGLVTCQLAESKDYSGAFEAKKRTDAGWSGSGGDESVSLKFDASKSNAIYGKSDTVQPKSITVRVIIKAFNVSSNGYTQVTKLNTQAGQTFDFEINETSDFNKPPVEFLKSELGSWNKAVHGTDYTYGYPANDILRVNILADGDYKINYVK